MTNKPSQEEPTTLNLLDRDAGDSADNIRFASNTFGVIGEVGHDGSAEVVDPTIRSYPPTDEPTVSPKTHTSIQDAQYVPYHAFFHSTCQPSLSRDAVHFDPRGTPSEEHISLRARCTPSERYAIVCLS